MSRTIYAPMLAREAESPFSSPEWFFEIKWDGVRAVCYTEGPLSLLSRYGHELAPVFPELAGIGEAAPGCVLDGEIIVMREGRPDIQPLLERLQRRSPAHIQEYAARSPVTYVVFDILELQGKPLIDRALADRFGILADTVQSGGTLLRSDPVADRGEEYYRAAVDAGLEGIIAKRKNSTYEPGRRSANWLKIKKLHTIDAVVFGYTPGRGRRAGTFGALILGVYGREGPVYIGKVGTGFSDADTETFAGTLRTVRVQEPTLGGV